MIEPIFAIRSSANGATGRQMIRSVDAANLARLDSPSMAMALARLRSPAIPPELLAELASSWAGLGAGFADGTLQPVVGQELPLAEAARAQQRVMDQSAYGKTVLTL